jgi:excisionase family DNA binding protein
MVFLSSTMKTHVATTEDGSSSLAALITKIETTGDLSLLPALRRRLNQPDLLNKKEAAALLTIAVRTIDDWRAAKILPCVTIGGIVRFRREDLEHLIAAHTILPRKAPAYRPRRRKTQNANPGTAA